jgi:hypothetical protein
MCTLELCYGIIKSSKVQPSCTVEQMHVLVVVCSAATAPCNIYVAHTAVKSLDPPLGCGRLLLSAALCKLLLLLLLLVCGSVQVGWTQCVAFFK